MTDIKSHTYHITYESDKDVTIIGKNLNYEEVLLAIQSFSEKRVNEDGSYCIFDEHTSDLAISVPVKKFINDCFKTLRQGFLAYRDNLENNRFCATVEL